LLTNQPIYITTHNVNSAEATRTNFFTSWGRGLNLNLEGENMTIGVWDGDNVRDTHSEFQSDDFTQGSRISSPDFEPQMPTATMQHTLQGHNCKRNKRKCKRNGTKSQRKIL
jgi:hypothetical protein